MSPAPNIISASRGVAALAMLFFPVFSPGFWVLYCWCGVSDMIDGPVARKLGAVSELGSRIDSVADLVFVICSTIMILPSVHLPVWIWLWTAAIGAIKLGTIVIRSHRRRRLTIPHSTTNRITGILLYFLPAALLLSEILIPAIFVCTVATFSLWEDYKCLVSDCG